MTTLLLTGMASREWLSFLVIVGTLAAIAQVSDWAYKSIKKYQQRRLRRLPGSLFHEAEKNDPLSRFSHN